MAQTLNKTKRRITSIKSTKKITEAMELVSTVKYKKFKAVLDKEYAYSEEIDRLISTIFSAFNEQDESVYTKYGEGNKDLVVVITSSLGLCASYNINIINYVLNNVEKENSILVTIGLKGANALSKEGYEIKKDFVTLMDQFDYDDSFKLGHYLHNEFISGKYHSIKVIYTDYINALKCEPFEKVIFPIKPKELENTTGYPPIFDTNVKTLIAELMPIYVVSTISQKLLESHVSEQSSRRNAMENANDNADEIIDKLTLEFNKARQAAITQEITEVVASQSK